MSHITIKNSILSKTNAIKRLYADMAEILRDPIWRANAAPVNDNIFEWHANICGPDGSAFAEVPIHVVIKFTNAYPTEPPVVRLGSTIDHPNVFGTKLCLDMLEEGEWQNHRLVNQRYTGWSSAYSVSSILRQLQVFLLDRTHGIGSNSAAAAKKYQCPICRHKGTAPWPLLNDTSLIHNKLIHAPKSSLTNNKSLARLVEKLKIEQAIQASAKEAQIHSQGLHEENSSVTASDSINQKNQPSNEDAKELSSEVTPEESMPKYGNGANNAKDNNQKKKKKKPMNQRQAPIKKIIPTAGFIIEDAINGNNEEKSTINGSDSYIDQLVRHNIEKEKQKLQIQQQKKTKTKKKAKNSNKTNQAKNNDHVTTSCDLTPVKMEVTPVQELQLFDLPMDIILDLAEYLQWMDIRNLTSVSKLSRSIMEESYIWKTLCMKYCGKTPQVIKKLSVNETNGHSSLYGEDYSWREIFLKSCEFITNEIRCFHSKISFEDDVLGIPINVTFSPGTNGWIERITSTLDLVSHEALSYGIRKACWKEPFQDWMPLYINQKHAAKALPLFKSSVAKMLKVPAFRSIHVLTVLPKLMSTMVVDVMSENKHASFKAFEGYCWFHRWFLEFVSSEMSFKVAVDRRIESFKNSEHFRLKKETPSLGEWICLLSVSDKFTWSDVSAAYLNESFTRNVKWSLHKYPELGTQGLDPEERAAKTFDGALVSIRLLMFHVFFLEFVKPKGTSIQRLKEQYDAFYGMISHTQKEQFQQEVLKILQVSTWEEFFDYIHVKQIPSVEEFSYMLEDTVMESFKRGYHGRADLL